MSSICRFIVPLFALACVACDAPPPHPASIQRTDEIGEARPGEVRRSWIARNDQAASIAGGLRLTPDMNDADAMTFAFAEGITVRARILTPDQAREALGAAFGEIPPIIGAAETLEPWVYRVEFETVAMSAPRGGLCGGLRTSFLVVAEYVSPENEWILRIASFHRNPEGDAPAHACFAFDYGLAAG